MHLTVLSRSTGIFTTRRIVQAARVRGFRVRVIDPLEVEMELGGAGPALYHRGRPFPRTDVVIPRIGFSINQYGLAVVNQLELTGVPVLNGARAVAASRDKMRVLQLLAASGVRVPHTVMASGPAGLKERVQLVGGLPVLLKLLSPSEKTGVMVCETRQALESALEAIERLGQNTVVQEYLHDARGRDIRVLVVGGRVVAALRRRPRVGRLARTLGQGAHFERLEVRPAFGRAALDAARVVGLEVCAVDMLEVRGGPRVFEVNSSPGIREAEEACGVDVAAAIVDRAAEVLADRTGVADPRADRGARP